MFQRVNKLQLLHQVRAIAQANRPHLGTSAICCSMRNQFIPVHALLAAIALALAAAQISAQSLTPSSSNPAVYKCKQGAKTVYGDAPCPGGRPVNIETTRGMSPSSENGASAAATLYLCRAYNGGTFWAQTHCGQQNALIEKMVSVPATLPFNQQVALGEQERQASSNNNRTSSTVTNTVINNGPSPLNKNSECKALDAQISQFDAMARQPQSGQTQDWITGEKKKARDRQFRIGC